MYSRFKKYATRTSLNLAKLLQNPRLCKFICRFRFFCVTLPPNQRIITMKRLFLFLLPLLLFSCQKQMQVASVSTEAIAIDSSVDAIQDTAYLALLAPKKVALEHEMSVVLGHAPEPLRVYSPECPMLNWASDALLTKARQLYPGRVDMAVVNIGGMRCEWQAGDITRQDVFQLMPFDNELVVLTLRGEDILELCQVFAEDYGQGVAGLRMAAEDKQLIDAQIDGESIDPEAYYTVATSDYLSGGTDHMTPLTHYIDIWHSDRLIRELYLEVVQEQGTVIARVDGRMDIH